MPKDSGKYKVAVLELDKNLSKKLENKAQAASYPIEPILPTQQLNTKASNVAEHVHKRVTVKIEVVICADCGKTLGVLMPHEQRK